MNHTSRQTPNTPDEGDNPPKMDTKKGRNHNPVTQEKNNQAHIAQIQTHNNINRRKEKQRQTKHPTARTTLAKNPKVSEKDGSHSRSLSPIIEVIKTPNDTQKTPREPTKQITLKRSVCEIGQYTTKKQKRPAIIMGDSNIGQLPHIMDGQIQVDSYPGAKLSHAAHIIKHRTPTTKSITDIILIIWNQ